MKVDLYKGYNLNRATQYRNEGIQQNSAQNAMPKYDEYPLGYMPHQVSFKAIPPHVIHSTLLNVEGLPCAYCGNLMIPKKVYDAMLPKTKITDALEYSRSAIKTIQGYEEVLKPVPKQVFAEIKAYVAQNPEATIKDTFSALRPSHLPRLQASQHSALNDIDTEAQSLPEEAKKEIRELTQRARTSVNSDNDKDFFRRKPFLFRFRNILFSHGLLNHPGTKKLNAAVLSLPTSRTNVDAFIVKYSGPRLLNPPKNKNQRKALDDMVNISEKNILRQIQVKHGNLNPDLSTQEIIDQLYPQSVKIITSTNSSAAKGINGQVASFISNLQGLATTSRAGLDALVLDESKSSSSKRKAVFDEINKYKEILDEETFEELTKTADKMPFPERSDEALVVDNHARALELLEKNRQSPYAMKNLNYSRISLMLKGNKYANSACTPEILEEKYPAIATNLLFEQQKCVKEIFTTIEKYLSGLNENIAPLTEGFKTKSLQEQSSILLKSQDLNLPEQYKSQISEILANLPSSKNDINAFVIKFSTDADTVPHDVWVEQTDAGIAQKIVRPSVSSLDHLKSQKSYKDENRSGEKDKFGNIAIVCKEDNEEKLDTELTDFIHSHPKILAEQYPQKQANVLRKKMNSGELAKEKSYLPALATTYFIESKGLINIDLAKLIISKKVLEEVKQAKQAGHLKKSKRETGHVRRSQRKKQTFLKMQEAKKAVQKEQPPSVHEAA